MKTLVASAFALTLAASAALAQTTAPSTTAPAEKVPSVTAPAPSTGGTAMSPTMAEPNIVLTDDQAKNWVDKTVYSSDGSNVGEVASFQRDSSGKVTEMHADIGGFLGIGETRVRVTPSQFRLAGDRVELLMTADQAKSLPKVDKK